MKSDFIRGAVFSRSRRRDRSQSSSVLIALLIIEAFTHTLTRSEEIISERECDKTSKRQHKEREELALMRRESVS